MTTWKQIAYSILAALGGVAAYFISRPLLIPWVNLGWRRPIQEWMIAHGAGNLVGHFGIFYIQIPDYITAIIVGVAIGIFAWQRWWQMSLVYSGTLIAMPYVFMFIDGSISNIWNRSVWLFFFLLLIHVVNMPLVLASAYLITKSRRRRHFRRVHQLCINCGYNLTGNTSGTCPECGSEIKE